MQKDMVCLEDESTHALPYYNNVIQSCDPFTERQCLIHVYESYEHAGESLSECAYIVVSHSMRRTLTDKVKGHSCLVA